jgi:voltage-gated potassium channel
MPYCPASDVAMRDDARAGGAVGPSTVVVGFGVTGTSAARQVLRHGGDPADLMVVDVRPEAVPEASSLDIPAVCGEGTVRGTLARVVSRHTRYVLVTAGPDAVAVMITMLARDLCPSAEIITAVREAELARFARRAGADEVIVTSHWAGRALALVLDRIPPEPPS